ncbi:hypothetical protein FH608_046255 [Nonomuraea phyllanthi]|uniref:Uncharacterized protein n=1 Tax=Nonomuraea phyllanthi TaxID=2219224 RepID=A0A5C4V8S9_9ACTN|nr:hypothetical protein [Nonomuraea phyllanthi]KAB8186898.1 hypothetical protein FH608_046255 [Nonomuraea phyllanthi]
MFDPSISPEGACVGSCNHRSREAWRAYHKAREAHAAAVEAWLAAGQQGEPPAEPEQPDVRFWPGAPLVCENDKAKVRAALADLDELMTLRLLYGDGYEARGESERVSGSAEPPSPSSAYDDLNDLLGWLRHHETTYRASQLDWLTAPYRGASASALTSAVGWLSKHLDGILAHPELAAEFAEGVLRWTRRIDQAAKARPRRRSKPLRCPQCHLATLSQMDGEDKIECRNRDCGASRGGPVVMTQDEYDALVLEKAS